jgi:hypothetical protein
MKIVTVIVSLLWAVALSAQIEVSVSSIESQSNKSVVRLEASHQFTKDVKDARAWVFLLDADGKVVGNQAHWIIGGDSSAKVIFSKIILADGTVVNPSKASKQK